MFKKKAFKISFYMLCHLRYRIDLKWKWRDAFGKYKVGTKQVDLTVEFGEACQTN